MTKEIYDYDVRCNTCFTKFKIQLFESHEKNLFVAAKKDWYCDTCKADYFEKQTSKLTESNKELGFPELEGTQKQISWAEKIRAELINKVDFLQKSLSFEDDTEKQISDTAFKMFLMEWHKESQAKWWVDNRRTTVRDISNRVKEITEDIKKDKA